MTSDELKVPSQRADRTDHVDDDEDGYDKRYEDAGGDAAAGDESRVDDDLRANDVPTADLRTDDDEADRRTDNDEEDGTRYHEPYGRVDGDMLAEPEPGVGAGAGAGSQLDPDPAHADATYADNDDNVGVDSNVDDDDDDDDADVRSDASEDVTAGATTGAPYADVEEPAGTEAVMVTEVTGVAESAPAHAAPQDSSLFDQDPAEVQGRWREVQTSFVDDPADAVQRADDLVGEVVEALTSSLTARTGELRDRWKDAGDTEQLRLALREYRVVLERLLTLSSHGTSSHGTPSQETR
jgi:hypothetical protein